MTERRHIVEAWRAGSAAVLATLVGIEGSSYRRPGARLLTCLDGTFRGSISAGCLEADILRKAAWLVRAGAVVHRYSSLLEEGSEEAPFGLGCGGVLDVLLEPAGTPEAEALLGALEASLGGEVRWVTTWLPTWLPGGAESSSQQSAGQTLTHGSAGPSSMRESAGQSLTRASAGQTPAKGSAAQLFARAVFTGAGQLVFASASLRPEQLAEAAAQQRTSSPIPTAQGCVTEHLLPAQRLLVFGAGKDVKPLLNLAGLLGWDSIVVDVRGEARTAAALGDRVEVLGSVAEAAARLRAEDAVVIMTHSFEQDREALQAALPLGPRYLGLLGSRQRSALLLAQAAGHLRWPLEACCAGVHAPTGLDLGGDGAEAIALAIAAEVQACCAGRSGGSRQLTAEHVERLLAEGGLHSFVHNRCALHAS